MLNSGITLANPMNQTILDENEAKRLHLPLPLLFCFAMFSAWQMGAVYFSGLALSVDGRTPLPLDFIDTTILIVAGYSLSIIWMIFLPRLVVWAQRVTAGAALLSALTLFLPMAPVAIAMAYNIQCFCCVFLIGFETCVIVNLFREETAILHLTIAYGLANFLVALIQNDLFPMSFSVFRIFMVAATAMQLLFYSKLPSKVWPRYVTKADGLVRPRRLFGGLYALGAIGALMMLFGNAVAETVTHGVSVFYIALSATLVLLYFIWKGKGISILRTGTIAMGVAVLGFVLAFLSLYVPVLIIPACVMLGSGGIVCLITPLFGVSMAKLYPSRFISPIIISLAFAMVMVHTALLDAFRDNLQILYICYLVITVGLAVLYFMLEPYLTYSFSGKSMYTPDMEKQDEAPEKPPAGLQPADFQSAAFNGLTTQELRVAELSLRGFTYTEIAKTMELQPNTIKWHQKNLYSKLQINSKRELFALAEKRGREPNVAKQPRPSARRPLLAKRG